MFVIESDGPAATPGLNRVIDPHTNAVLFFPTRKAAREHRATILPDQPSKYLPLVVREVIA
jgi:hypothetical protein